jgi:hypothetical protein
MTVFFVNVVAGYYSCYKKYRGGLCAYPAGFNLDFAELNIKFVYKYFIMTTTAIRQKLMTYLADADDSKVKAIYTLVEGDINKEDTFKLTDEQLQILDTEREMHLAGETKSYTRQEANEIIKGQRSF